jgi:hypothetical protein
MRYWTLCTFCFLAGFISAGPAAGQVTSAAIKGRITDPSAATIGGATLVIRQKDTGSQRAAGTELDGQYGGPRASQFAKRLQF